jgi:hypothetical protein
MPTRKPPTPTTATKPWHRKNPNPRGTHTKLSPEDKEAARQRAARAGRRYPNLIDNMWAASRRKPKP